MTGVTAGRWGTSPLDAATDRDSTEDVLRLVEHGVNPWEVFIVQMLFEYQPR